MRPTRQSNIRLGIYIASGVLLFIVILYLIGSRQHMFQRNVKITSTFQNQRPSQQNFNKESPQYSKFCAEYVE